jgi:CheY-like chemotaxis protein
VLLVEDNEINRRVALGHLRSRGHQAVVAENGREALDTLAEQVFDVVLMDMQMPVMDGYEATAEIRQREHQTGGHIPIVAMTAEAMRGDRERCLAVGMDDYVSKPIDPAEMYRAIERFPALCLVAEAEMRNSPASNSIPTESRIAPSPDLTPAEPQSPAIPLNAIPLPTLSVIDWKGVKECLGGGAEELPEFTGVMKKEASILLANIRGAIETRDSKLLGRSAHTLKGAVSYFGVETLVQAALDLENLGRSGSFDNSTELLAIVEKELARFVKALDDGPPTP